MIAHPQSLAALPLVSGGRDVNLSRKALGFLGELAVANALRALGYTVTKSGSKQGDLHVIDPDGVVFLVEVKIATLNRRGFWQYNLVRQLPDRLCTHYQYSDWLVLLAVDQGRIERMYLIPCDALSQTQISIGQQSRKYAPYQVETLEFRGRA